MKEMKGVLQRMSDSEEKPKPPRRTFPDKKDGSLKKKGKRSGGGVGDDAGSGFLLDRAGEREDDAVPAEKLAEYTFGGEKMRESGVRTAFGKAKLAQKRSRVEASVAAAARSELLNANDAAGFLEPEHGELTHLVTQQDLKRVVDIASATKTGTSYLHWTDVSIGKSVASFFIREGPLDVMCQNPANGIVHCGHPKGTVSLWSPNQKEAVVKLLTHGGPVRGVTVEASGKYMGTSGQDGRVRVWDLRMWKPLWSAKLPSAGLGQLVFSANKLLALSNSTSVQIFKDVTGSAPSLYLQHSVDETITDLEFAPFEDVLGIGHQGGFTSILVPGAGESNIDALEANPYQTKSQRKEWEVKALLDKIQVEMISMDTSLITEVDREALTQSMEEKAKILYVKPETITFKPKYKMKGRSKAGAVEKRKEAVRSEKRKTEIAKEQAVTKELLGAAKTPEKPKSVLDRFRSKS